MFQGPKGYIALICEVPAVWKQYYKMAVIHFFLVNSTLIYILFSLSIRVMQLQFKNITCYFINMINVKCCKLHNNTFKMPIKYYER